MALDLGTAWVQVSPSFRGFASTVNREVGSAVGGAFKSAAKVGTTAIATIGAAVGGLALKGGIDRALSIEQAQAKLKGLGHDAGSITEIMNDALASVKGTAFGLGDAATVAASMSAAGVKSGAQMTGVLKTVADTAQISGRSLTDIGAIFGSVAARGKLQGDDMLQLMSSGVPVLQFLSDQLGVTTADVSDMVSSGKIDFATFSAAMQKGLGGAALAGGETFTGAMANVRAALSRLGEAAAKPALDGLRNVFNALIPVIDKTTNALKPVFDMLGSKIAQASQSAASAIGAFSSKLDGIGKIDLSGLAGPLVGLMPILGAMGGALGPLLSGLPLVGGAFAGLTGPVGLAAGAMGAMVSASSGPLRDALGDLGGQVSRALPDAFGSLQGSLGSIGGALGRLGDAISPVVRAFGDIIGRNIGPVMESVKNAFGGVSDAVGALSPLIGTVAGALGGLAGGAVSAAVGVLKGIVDALSGIANWASQHGALVSSAVAGLAGAFAAMKAVGIASHIMQIVGTLGRLSAMGGLMSGLAVVFPNLANGLKVVTGAMKALNLSMLANPIVLVITAVVALVAAFVMAYKNSETFRNVIASVWNGIKTAVGAVVDWFSEHVLPVLQAVWSGIKSGAEWLWHNGIEPAWNGIKGAIGPVYDWITGTVGTGIGKIWDAISGSVTAMWQKGVVPAWDGLKGAIQPIYDWITKTVGPAISDAWDAIKNAALDLWHKGIEPAWNGITGAIGPVVDWIAKNVVPPIKSAFDTIKKAVMDLWTKAIKPAWDGIMQAIKPVIDYIVKEVWPKVEPVLKKFGLAILAIVGILIASPLLIIIGAIIAVLLILTGIIKGLEWVITKIIIPAVKAVVKATQEAYRFIVTIIANVINWFLTTVVPFFQSIGKAIGDVFNAVRDGIGAAFGWIKDRIVAPVVEWFQSTVVPKFEAVRNSVVRAFETLKDGVGRAWDALKDLAKKPVEFVVNTVAAGLVRAYNWVATKFGADEVKEPHVEFANGGFAGREAGFASSPILWAEAGPEAYIPLDPAKRTRSLGIWAKTGQMLGALPMADGGIIGNIIGGIGNAAAAIGNFIKSPIEWLMGRVRDLIDDVGSSPFAQIAAKIPGKIADDIGAWVKEHMASIFGGGGSGSEAFDGWWNAAVAINPDMAPYKQIAATVAQNESGFNPNVMNNWDSNAAAGTPSGGLMQFIQPTFEAYRWPGFDNWMGAVDQILAWWKYVNARYGGPFNIPGIASLAGGGGYVGYAGGTLNAAAGTAWVGENGPELVDFGGGESVYNRSQMDGLEDRIADRTISRLQQLRVALIVDGHQMGQVIDGRISMAGAAAHGSRW
ncbi:endolysin [Propionibacterium phage B22]|uniref:Tape measure protein n=1 Tax=Propionibacterium phage B22 TaxID=1897532 RepID=A0A1D8ETJ9_9CAUD|nr:endolysin [Propionibacterium phage B22]AOT24368.1 tape measure protein [Propionibacterium phage B22]